MKVIHIIIPIPKLGSIIIIIEIIISKKNYSAYEDYDYMYGSYKDGNLFA